MLEMSKFRKSRQVKVILFDSSGKNVIMAEKIKSSNSESELRKERNRLKVREWRKQNPDKYKKHLEYVKEWRRNNKERVKERSKEWYQRNRDWLLEYYRNYYHNKKNIKSTKNDRNTIRSKRKIAGK